jgi:o-succinylbenzoate synthase
MTVEPFALDLATPLETAAGTVERREGFLVRVTVDGTEGVGEATPLGPWTETLEATRTALGAVRDADPEAALDAVDPVATPAAAHGVELAVLDARARTAEVPLADHLTDELADHLADGRQTADRVPVNATVGDADADATAEAASEVVAEGFETLKIKVGARRLSEDVERLQAVREAVGAAVELRADANAAWRSVPKVRTALGNFADLGVSYVEQPLPAEDLAGLADLRGGEVGIALDESLAVHTLEEVLAADAADVLILKPMALGGPARAAAAAARARDAGITSVVTTTIDGVHARTAAVHVAATVPDVPACGLATADLLVEDLADDPAPVDDGHVEVPAGPGNLGDRTDGGEQS